MLIVRVLYRLHSVAEQTPFDAATFSYASPLLSQVLMKGGIELSEEDDPLEQIALVVNIIKFHCGECESPSGITRGLLAFAHRHSSLEH